MTSENTAANNRGIVSAMYKAALSGDVAGFMAALDPGVVVHEPSFLPYGGVSRGHAEFGQLLGTIARYIDIGSIRVDSLVAEGDTVVAFLSAKSAGTGEPLLLAERSLLRNGKIVDMAIYYHEGGSLFPRAER